CYNFALENYDNALEILLKLINLEHISNENQLLLARTRDNVGSTCYKQEMYGRALEEHDYARKLREEFSSDDFESIVKSYSNIALDHLEIDKKYFPLALENCKKALKIANEKHLAALHPACAWAEISYGKYYFKTGKYDEAIEKYQRALNIFEKALLNGHPDVAFAHLCLGQYYFKTKNYPEALQSDKKALAIYTQQIIQNDQDIKNCMYYIEQAENMQ
ncbi:unnamed protein product, partial [Didymodactylos carnosus]